MSPARNTFERDSPAYIACGRRGPSLGRSLYVPFEYYLTLLHPRYPRLPRPTPSPPRELDERASTLINANLSANKIMNPTAFWEHT